MRSELVTLELLLKSGISRTCSCRSWVRRIAANGVGTKGISPLGETIVRDVSKSLPNLKLCYSRVPLLPWPLEWHCADPKESANH